MIVICPSCEARYELPAARVPADGMMMKCSSCGHGWLEARAIELATAPARQVPALIEHDYEPDLEVRRLVEASRDAQHVFADRRRQRNRTLAGWGGLAAGMASIAVLALASPETVVRLAPATVAAYDLIGREVNVYGLDVRRVELKHMTVDGTRVLAIKGDIANISGSERKLPWLRFGLRDGGNKEVYFWTLDTGARPLREGESTGFVTRIASPPEAAKNLEIRFARADEIGSTAGHE